MVVNKCFTRSKFTERPGNMNENLQAENGQKLTNLNQYILTITNINKKLFAIFEQTINNLSFGYVRLSQFEYYFSCFFFYYLLIYFFFPCYLLLNR